MAKEKKKLGLKWNEINNTQNPLEKKKLLSNCPVYYILYLYYYYYTIYYSFTIKKFIKEAFNLSLFNASHAYQMSFDSTGTNWNQTCYQRCRSDKYTKCRDIQSWRTNALQLNQRDDRWRHIITFFYQKHRIPLTAQKLTMKSDSFNSMIVFTHR